MLDAPPDEWSELRELVGNVSAPVLPGPTSTDTEALSQGADDGADEPDGIDL